MNPFPSPEFRLQPLWIRRQTSQARHPDRVNAELWQTHGPYVGQSGRGSSP
jgi:hypothetical protein